MLAVKIEWRHSSGINESSENKHRFRYLACHKRVVILSREVVAWVPILTRRLEQTDGMILVPIHYSRRKPNSRNHVSEKHATQCDLAGFRPGYYIIVG